MPPLHGLPGIRIKLPTTPLVHFTLLRIKNILKEEPLVRRLRSSKKLVSDKNYSGIFLLKVHIKRIKGYLSQSWLEPVSLFFIALGDTVGGGWRGEKVGEGRKGKAPQTTISEEAAA